tara:strand:+ start:28 stop:1353 length:1326 start_codon:yes stop_codon:yes gene_type:complete
MADPVTSGINPVTIGSGKDKKEIYTATKVTPTTDAKGNKTYVMEVVQYDNAKGEGGRVIGTRNGKEITFNDNASDEIKGDAKAIKKINNQSSKQAKSVKNQVATTSADQTAFKNANNKGNEGTEYENDQATAKLKNASSEISSSGGAGTPKPGTRNEGFPGAGGKNPLVFPKTLRRDVANGQDFLKINMMKYAPKDFDNKSFAFSERDINRETIGTVILPIPGGIQDGQSVQWGQSTMTPLDMAKADIALAGVSKGLTAAVATAGEAAEKLATGFGPNKKALAAVIAGMAAGAGDLLTRTTGAVTNPNMELLFGGPQLRTFSFQFTLAPRSKDEGMEAVKIIRFFKQGMAPIRTKSMLFLKSPHTFRLSYRKSANEEQKYLNKFKECALGTFGVNYTPNGNYSTYEDGVMTAYQMTMTFRELDPIYNDDYGSDPFPEEIGF